MRPAAFGAVALLAGLFGAAALQARRRFDCRILRISRVVADLDRAVAFYRDGLGFRQVAHGPGDPALPAVLGLENTTSMEAVMRIGAQEIALVRFDPPGAPYPADSRSDDLWFQHLAIVVNDMEAAFRHLSAQSFHSISKNGPERLPPRNGGVIAFKLRDPDGHPLELIHFPPGQGRAVWQANGPGPFLGIDHSALAVGATGRSTRFYQELGFRVAGRSMNYGSAQSDLDGLDDAKVRVTSLRPRSPTGPGLELLGYVPPGRPAPAVSASAAITDWVTLLVPGLQGGRPLPAGYAAVRRDPDGHIMLLVDRAYGAVGTTVPAFGPLT